MMNRRELEEWLGLDSTTLGFGELAEVLHVVLDASRESLAIADAEELRSLRFVLAVLRDIFPSDAAVRAWLTSPCFVLDGQTPAELLTAGRVHELAELAVREWNRPRLASRIRHLRAFAPSVTAR